MTNLKTTSLCWCLILSSCVTPSPHIFKHNSEMTEQELTAWDESIARYKTRVQQDFHSYRQAILSTNSTVPMLWKVEKPGQHTSYLLGTIHEGIAWSSFPIVLKRCVSDATQITFEVDEHNGIPGILSSEVESAEGSNGTMSLRNIRHLKVWNTFRNELLIIKDDYLLSLSPQQAKLLFLTVKELFVLGEGPRLDFEIMEQAIQEKKPINSLDSDEDLKFARQALLKYEKPYTKWDFIKDFERDPYAVFHAYIQKIYELQYRFKLGQISDIENLVAQQETYDALIAKRNSHWIPKMILQIARQPTFFVVGIGHMTGPASLLKGLAEEGYQVSRVSECAFEDIHLE